MAANPIEANLAARNLILSRSQPMCQPIYSTTVTAANIAAGANVINVTPRNVGLLKGFIVKVSGTLTNGGASTANRTGRGAYNALSQIVYTDLQNNQRVNTTGWHIGMLNTAKLGYGYGAAYAPNLPAGFGANWTVESLASTLATMTDASLTVMFYIPIAYSADDLTGAIYTGVTGATQNLQLTINPNVGYTTGDSLMAIMGGTSTTITWKTGTSVTVSVYQDYWDQLPATQQGVILPMMDIGTSYMINNTSVSGITANQDFPIQYANFRKFLSTFALFNNVNSGSPNGEAAFGTGADVNQWKLATANYTYIYNLAPEIVALQSRIDIMSDWPAGMYYFNHRRRPIDTVQYGNMQLLLNAATVNSAAAYIALGYESFADTNIVTQAGSLPGG